MSYIETIPLDAADGAVREMYERQQEAWGYVPNYAKSFSHRPAVMERWGKLLAEIRRPMDKRMFELITFAAAHELRNSPCSLAHGNALRAFFTKVLDAVGSLPDAGFMKIDADLRAHLAVGKPISNAKDAVMNDITN